MLCIYSRMTFWRLNATIRAIFACLAKPFSTLMQMESSFRSWAVIDLLHIISFFFWFSIFLWKRRKRTLLNRTRWTRKNSQLIEFEPISIRLREIQIWLLTRAIIAYTPLRLIFDWIQFQLKRRQLNTIIRKGTLLKKLCWTWIHTNRLS